VKLLLDTHTFLWMVQDFSKLSPAARAAVDDANNHLFLSSASVWELAVKVGSGKMKFGRDLSGLIADGITQIQASPLPITHEHALAVERLPSNHNDPFDRVIFTQARIELMTVVTKDRWMSTYGIPVIW
jgi:PIN domain nuclease of toxin-antitoxin system